MAGLHTIRRHRQFRRVHTCDNEAAHRAVHLRTAPPPADTVRGMG
jgi:hypothetical protein